MTDAVELAAAAIPQAAAASTSGGARVATALRSATRWSLLAAGSVLAAGSAAWTLIAAATWALQQVTVPEQIAATTGAYTALVVLGAAVALGITSGRRFRYLRRERRAERARWTASQPGFDAALAAKRAEPVKTPKPALPRPLGLPIS